MTDCEKLPPPVLKKSSNALPKPLKRPGSDWDEKFVAINEDTASFDWVSQIGGAADAGALGTEYVSGELAWFAEPTVTMVDCCGAGEFGAATVLDEAAGTTAFSVGTLK
jgi:hypothetical protein